MPDSPSLSISILVATLIPVVASSIALFLTELLPLPVCWSPPSSSVPKPLDECLCPGSLTFDDASAS